MANSTEYENSTSATEVTSWNAYSTSMAILAGINIFLAITASLGNTLILIALHKVTSIYPPTNCYFDAWQSPIFQLDLSLNHCMLLFSFPGSQLGMRMSQLFWQTGFSFVCFLQYHSLHQPPSVWTDSLPCYQA